MHGSGVKAARSFDRQADSVPGSLVLVEHPVTPVTLILPVRDWAPERIEASTQSFLALPTRAIDELIVVDFGSSSPVTLPARHDPRLKLLRLDAKVWSLAEAINAGVLIARNEIVAKTDADILVGPGSAAEFERLAAEVAAGAIGLAVTQAIDLHQSLDVGEALRQVAAGRHPLGRLRAKWGQGGLVIFARSVWNRIGGFDSRFTGWGNEDNDFAERVRRSGLKLAWADREALRIYHVWHPPTYAATGVLTQRQTNQKIASSDHSVLRPVAFRHSNFGDVAAPALKAAAPLVTLGIATTARPHRNRMILEAINSFRGQIGNDFEIMVLDNGSSDDEFERLRERLSRIRWTRRLRVERQVVGSIPASRNAISRLAEGRYICVVDDDDLALPNRLADHLKVFESDGMRHGSHGGWIDFDESTGIIERNSGKVRSAATLLKGTGKVTAHPASFYRTDVMRAVPYDEAFALGSDLDLALRLANLGFDIGHTNSFLTLRRYHSANVTITGQSNQVSNGNTARARTLATFGWNKVAGLEERAKSNDNELYCRNQLSIDSLAELIPGYSGRWQIFVPLSAVSGVDGAVPATDADAPQATLEALAEIVEVDLCTRRSGLNQPICLRTVSIPGLRQARRIKERLEALTCVPVALNSVRQAELDREVPFQWKLIEIKAGERVLSSEPFADLAEIMAILTRLGPKSLLARSLSIVSDFADGAEAYCLVSRPIKGHEEVRAMRFDLERLGGIPFHAVAANGVVSELTPARG